MWYIYIYIYIYILLLLLLCLRIVESDLIRSNFAKNKPISAKFISAFAFRKNDFLCGNRYSQIPDHSIFLKKLSSKDYLECYIQQHITYNTVLRPIPLVPLFLFRRFSRRLSNAIREYVMSVLNHISLHT